MSRIKDLYLKAGNDIKDELEQYIRFTKDFKDEIALFKTLVSDSNYEKALCMFYIEVLSKGIKKPAEFNDFISTLLAHVDELLDCNNNNKPIANTNTDGVMKYSIFVLRALKSLMNCRFFIPISFYLTKLMSAAMNVKNLKKLNKKIDYDSIRISNDLLNSEELQMFVIKECLVLIKRHCHSFGNSIGFPEFATVLCNELRMYCKVGIYRELTSELIKYISTRKSYIEEQRNALKVDATNIEDFEKNLVKWEIE